MLNMILKVAPIDPTYLPPIEVRHALESALSGLLPHGEASQTKYYGRVSLIDPGLNLEAIICPSCSVKTYIDFYSNPDDIYYDVDPGAKLWWGIVDRLNCESALNVLVDMPCCGSTTPLMSLIFDWPAMFASFEIDIFNPEAPDELAQELLPQLETIVGCKLTLVRALVENAT